MTPRLSIFPTIALGRRLHGHDANRKYLFVLLLGLILSMMPLPAEDIFRSNFESSTPDYNPWAGVTDTGLIKVLPGKQPYVNDEGKTTDSEFGPSVAVGDLNGDGLPDLVIADSHGFFWYFPNSGTPTLSKFTHGEIMPIWLGFSKGTSGYISGDGVDNVIPKIQLISLGGDGKKLDLVVGNYVGRLFYIYNTGSATTPDFRMPQDRAQLIVPTHKGGLLWCNFLSPFLYDWSGNGNLDLIMGEGTYSANSIYLLQNKGDRDRPVFNEDYTTKIIPGMGREHLTPQVVDWNNDGKPDIISGDRTGHINLFLNTSANPQQPTFDQGQVLKFGSKENFGELTTATVCDLTGNKLPNLIITNAKGAILYAQNIGKLGTPQFGETVPMRGINPFAKIFRPVDWTLRSPHGVPHELLVCTNAAVEPGFTPPPNTTFKNALRYFVYPVMNTYFKKFYYPEVDGGEEEYHGINHKEGDGFKLTEDVDYKLSFWVRTTGNIKDFKWHVTGSAQAKGQDARYLDINNPVNSSTSWNLFEDTVRFDLNDRERNVVGSFNFNFTFNGQGEIYLDDIWLRTAN